MTTADAEKQVALRDSMHCTGSSLDNGVCDVLFFSRGRGRGHAIPDIAIMERLQELVSDVRFRFVSYGTGFATFLTNGWDPVDLRMPDDNGFLDTIIKATRIIGRVRPRLVISHEEFAALPASKVFGIPAFFITEWFDSPESLQMDAVRYASETIFIEEAGIFEEPHYLAGRVHYVGPVLRRLSYRPTDWLRAREELLLSPTAKVLTIMPGSWTEHMAPISDLVEHAFDTLGCLEKHLIWIAGKDGDLLRARFKSRSDVTITIEDWRLDRLMVASDVVVTKTNRGTVRELSALSTPSISLSFNLNRMDDALVSRIPGNFAIQSRDLQATTLSELISRLFRECPIGSRQLRRIPEGAELAASRIASHLDLVRTRDAAAAQSRSVQGGLALNTS